MVAVADAAVVAVGAVDVDAVKKIDSKIPGIKNVIAVGSGKGGVGKSTVAVNIALALSQEGAKVGLLDADIYGPSIPIMLGLQNEKPKFNEAQKILPLESYQLKTMSIGFIAEKTQAIIWRGPMIHKILDEFLSRVEWGNLDYLIVDLPPGTGDVQLSLSQFIPMTGAVVVTTPQDVALADVERAVEMFRKVNIPLLGVVENMSAFVCSKCHHEESIFSFGGGEKAAKEWGVSFLGRIPLVTDVRKGGDTGVPIVAANNEAFVSQKFFEIARNLVGIVNQVREKSPEIQITK